MRRKIGLAQLDGRPPSHGADALVACTLAPPRETGVDRVVRRLAGTGARSTLSSARATASRVELVVGVRWCCSSPAPSLTPRSSRPPARAPPHAARSSASACSVLVADTATAPSTAAAAAQCRSSSTSQGSASAAAAPFGGVSALPLRPARFNCTGAHVRSWRRCHALCVGAAGGVDAESTSDPGVNRGARDGLDRAAARAARTWRRMLRR